MISLTFAIIACSHIAVVIACGGGGRRPPPPCTWRTCSARYDSTYSPNINDKVKGIPEKGVCIRQVRRCHHHYQTHRRNGGCPGSTNCHQRDIARTWCKCPYPEHNGGWGEWKVEKVEGDCRIMKRETIFSKMSSVERSSCHGTENGNKQTETKKECACEIYSYTNNGFGEWKDVSNSFKDCKEQERFMTFTRHTKVEHHKVCPAANPPPSNPERETRKVCLCEVRHFIEDGWSEWTTKEGQENKECVDQERKMHYMESGVTADYNVECPQLLDEPAHVKSETRKLCLPCKVFVYVDKGWSEWKTVSLTSDGKCQERKRYKKYDFVQERHPKKDGVCPPSPPFDPVTEFSKC